MTSTAPNFVTVVTLRVFVNPWIIFREWALEVTGGEHHLLR